MVSLPPAGVEHGKSPAVQRLFDSEFYLSRNRDVQQAGIDPLDHYLDHGWREGRNPSASFSTNGYLGVYPELRAAGICPLLHAAALSVKGISDEAAAFFDRGFYLQRHPELDVPGVDPLQHYLNAGWKLGYDPGPGFSTEHYLAQVPELAGGDRSPLEHWAEEGRLRHVSVSAESPALAARRLRHGFWNDQLRALLGGAGLDLGPVGQRPEAATADLIIGMFSASHYRRRHPAGADEGDLAALTRYLIHDLPRGEAPGPLFDAGHYLSELAARGMPPPAGAPFSDWLTRGYAAGISPHPAFVADEYRKLNPDVPEDDVLDHWIGHGLSENRQFMANVHIARRPDSRVGNGRSLTRIFAEDVAGRAGAELAGMRAFRNGPLEDMVAAARAIEPAVGAVPDRIASYVAPWHDDAFFIYRACLDRIGPASFTDLVMMPFCKMGGADFVAGTLARALSARGGRVLVLRTEQPDWERPDWFPADAVSADLSDLLKPLQPALRAQILYTIIHRLDVQRLFNVNSRAAYEMLTRHGARLSPFTALYVYYFCADRTPAGLEVGYAIDHFATLQNHLDAALIDNADFARVLVERHMLPPQMAARVVPIYSPAMDQPCASPVVEAQIESRAGRGRPRFIWAGRLDRQKRFDLVQQVARAMPDCDFLCWGKAVLDAPPTLDALPANLQLMGTYGSMRELPLADSDGWLYTSGWDGLPTILIEIAAAGVPVVASAVGGVPELIDEGTGWPVPGDAEADAYVAALRDMLARPEECRRRATALYRRAQERHSLARYRASLDAILEQETARCST